MESVWVWPKVILLIGVYCTVLQGWPTFTAKWPNKNFDGHFLLKTNIINSVNILEGNHYFWWKYLRHLFWASASSCDRGLLLWSGRMSQLSSLQMMWPSNSPIRTFLVMTITTLPRGRSIIPRIPWTVFLPTEPFGLLKSGSMRMDPSCLLTTRNWSLAWLDSKARLSPVDVKLKLS